MSQIFKPFQPREADSAGILSWIHIGDLHMTEEGQQNDRDLRSIASEINRTFADSVSFVYLPGDNADDGSNRAYDVARKNLDRLKVPWCAIIGDHDVHEKSFANFLTSMGQDTYYSFCVRNVKFLALNAFDIPDPRSFAILPRQMEWIKSELQSASMQNQQKVTLLHCYPSDLRQGRAELINLISQHQVCIVDMGHTHCNEISNDGKTVYTATRSTGQIEEGPAGFSVTNLDGEIVSWRFFEPGKQPFVMITSPGDERLLSDFLSHPPRPPHIVWMVNCTACKDGLEDLPHRVNVSKISHVNRLSPEKLGRHSPLPI